MELKKSKILHFPKGLVHGFCQKLKILFLFSFSVKQSETRCFVTFWVENLPIQTRKTLILKSRKLALLHSGQSMVFGQKQESLLLFSFSAKYSKTKCFVSLQIEIQPFKTTKIWIQKSRKLLFFKTGKAMGFGQKLETLSFFIFQLNWPKQIAFCDLVDRNLAT